MSFVTAALIGGGAALLGGYMSSSAIGSAADTQANSAAQATALQKQMFDEQNALNKPVRDNGLAGQNRLMDLLGLSGNTGATGYGSAGKNFTMSDFNADPGYQFRLDQGNRALERTQAARGGLLSGGAMKDAMAYNQGQASQEYGNAYNRFQTDRSNILNPLQSLAGQGQTVSGSMAANAGAYGTNVGNTLTQSGNAQASSILANNNALVGALNQGVSSYNTMNGNRMNGNRMGSSPGIYNPQTGLGNAGPNYDY
jgi:hypothetical protein